MTPAAIKPAISKAHLDQVDVRVGTIEAVEDVLDAAKLVALRVSFGDPKRTIVAGMKGERENVQEIVGRQALFVVNLEPRKMRSVLSEGMLFDLLGVGVSGRSSHQQGLKPDSFQDPYGTAEAVP